MSTEETNGFSAPNEDTNVARGRTHDAAPPPPPGPEGAQKTPAATRTHTPLERRTGLATADTTRGPLHPLRAAAPVTGHHTPHEALHPLRGATPDQKGCTAYGSGAVPPITRTNAESARRSPIRTRPRKHAQFDEVLRRRERDTHKTPEARSV